MKNYAIKIIVCLIVLGSTAMATEEWILGQPEQTDTTNYEWVLGQPSVYTEASSNIVPILHNLQENQ